MGNRRGDVVVYERGGYYLKRSRKAVERNIVNLEAANLSLMSQQLIQIMTESILSSTREK